MCYFYRSLNNSVLQTCSHIKRISEKIGEGKKTTLPYVVNLEIGGRLATLDRAVISKKNDLNEPVFINPGRLVNFIIDAIVFIIAATVAPTTINPTTPGGTPTKPTGPPPVDPNTLNCKLF